MGADAAGASSAAADGAVGTPSDAAAPLAVGGSVAAEPPAGAWETGDACCWAPDPPTGTTLEAEGEEALTNKDGLRPVGMIITQRYKKWATLTSDPGPSSGPGSGTPAAVAVVVAAVAAAIVVAAGAPRGHHSQVVVVVAVAADPMVAVAEDWCASARPRPGNRSPWPRQLSSDASGAGPNQQADP
jgi:hypothetical protein